MALIDAVGGEEGLNKLVNDFYDIVETESIGARLFKLHLRGHGMSHVRSEQFAFLSGYLGGAKYYLEHHGHMNLKEIHKHVEIAEQDAEDWLSCMDKALAMNNFKGPEIERLRKNFRLVCYQLVNQ